MLAVMPTSFVIVKKEKTFLKNIIKKAKALAESAHKGQFDKAGQPYILHPLVLAEDLKGRGYEDKYIVVALLHDTLEDTDLTIDEICTTLDISTDSDIIEALKLLTHEQSVPYMTYIERLKCNKIARIVKMADLRHNMDLSRISHVTEKDLARIEKYKKAYALLEK